MKSSTFGMIMLTQLGKKNNLFGWRKGLCTCICGQTGFFLIYFFILGFLDIHCCDCGFFLSGGGGMSGPYSQLFTEIPCCRSTIIWFPWVRKFSCSLLLNIPERTALTCVRCGWMSFTSHRVKWNLQKKTNISDIFSLLHVYPSAGICSLENARCFLENLLTMCSFPTGQTVLLTCEWEWRALDGEERRQ